MNINYESDDPASTSLTPKSEHSMYSLMIVSCFSITTFISAEPTRSENEPMNERGISAPSFNSWTITVLDDATNAPILGAWVVAASQVDRDSDGTLSAAHGFTNGTGRTTLSLAAQESFPARVHVAADGYGAFMGRFLGPPDPTTTIIKPYTVRLSSKPHAQLFWARLDSDNGRNLGGIAIATKQGMQLPNSVTNSDGTFAFAVDRESPLKLILSGTPIEHTSWVVDPQNLGSFGDPTIIPVVRRHQVDFSAQVTTATNGIPLSGDLKVVYAPRSQTGEPNREWTSLVPLGAPSLGNFSGAGKKDAPFHIFAIDQGLWGYQHGSVLEASQAVSITLENPGRHALAVRVFTANMESTHQSGTVDLWVQPPTSDGSDPCRVRIRAATVNNAGEAIFDKVPEGVYTVIWKDGPNIAAHHGVHHKDDALTRTSVISRQGLNHGLHTDFAGPCNVSGTVAFGGYLGASVQVSVSSPSTGEVIRRAPVENDGSFMLQNLPGGIWRLGATGNSSAGEPLFALDGAGDFALDSASVTLPAPFKLYGSRSIIVHIAQAESDWTITSNPAANVQVNVTSSGTILHQGVTNSNGTVIFDLGLLSETAVVQIAGHPATDCSDPIDIETSELVSPQPLVMAIR